MPFGQKPKIVEAKPVGVPAPQRGKLSVLQQAQDHASILRLSMPELPVGEAGQPLKPQLPWNIDEVPLPDLGRLYGQFAAMATYAARHVGEADVEASDAKYDLSILEAKLKLTVDGANADERKSNVALDPSVMAASERHRVADAKFTFLKQLLAGYERSMATISREFSRRGIES